MEATRLEKLRDFAFAGGILAGQSDDHKEKRAASGEPRAVDGPACCLLLAACLLSENGFTFLLQLADHLLKELIHVGITQRSFFVAENEGHGEGFLAGADFITAVEINQGNRFQVLAAGRAQGPQPVATAARPRASTQ